MSWSFYVQGKPATVAERAKAERETERCAGAEEIARQHALEAIEALASNGCNSDCAIKVEASGSAYTKDGVQTSSQLKLTFETISAE